MSGVLLIQLTGINWGKEKDVVSGSYMRSLAKTIQASPAFSRVVVIGQEEGRGWYPAALIYELEPEVVIVTLGVDRELNEFSRLIEKYEYLWFVECKDETIVSIETRFLSGLLRSGFCAQASYPVYKAILLRRVGIAQAGSISG